MEFRLLGLGIINFAFLFSLSVFFNSLLARSYTRRLPSHSSLPGLHGKAIFPVSSLQQGCSETSIASFTWMTPVCLRTFPLPSSDETPSDGQLAGLTNVPGKFPSPRSILFWPRHHHRMPCTCAVTGRTKLFSWFTAPGQHECLHVLISALIPLACYQTAPILCHLMDTLSPSPLRYPTPYLAQASSQLAEISRRRRPLRHLRAVHVSGCGVLALTRASFCSLLFGVDAK